jgi:hypothetical protein
MLPEARQIVNYLTRSITATLITSFCVLRKILENKARKYASVVCVLTYTSMYRTNVFRVTTGQSVLLHENATRIPEWCIGATKTDLFTMTLNE